MTTDMLAVLRSRLEGRKDLRDLFETIANAASVTASPGILELCYTDPQDRGDESIWDFLTRDDSCALFQTASRMLLLGEFAGRLRFFAGGVGLLAYQEPSESGHFQGEREALEYALAFLVRGLPPEEIEVRRGVAFAR